MISENDSEDGDDVDDDDDNDGEESLHLNPMTIVFFIDLHKVIHWRCHRQT